MREAVGHVMNRLGVMLALPLLLPGAARAQDWPSYNGGAAGWRHNAGETTIGTANAGELVEKWRFPARDSADTIGVVHGTPVAVGGYVYFGTVNKPAFYKLAP